MSDLEVFRLREMESLRSRVFFAVHNFSKKYSFDEGVVLKALSDKIVSNPLSFGLTLGVDCRAIQESIFSELDNEMTKTKKSIGAS